MTTRFALGQVVATPGALEAIQDAAQVPGFFLELHASGNWGCVNGEDWKLNDEALQSGDRLLSAYQTLKGVKLWVLTEAADDAGTRLATTILIPDEY